MSNQRPNIIVLTFIFIGGIVRMLGESVIRGSRALFAGKFTPLKNTRPLRVWHWILVDGPKKFWKFPRSIQITRSLSTLIQVIFYPKK